MTFKLGNQAKTWGSAALFFLVTTVLCGVIYTAACTGLAAAFLSAPGERLHHRSRRNEVRKRAGGPAVHRREAPVGPRHEPQHGHVHRCRGKRRAVVRPSNLSPAGDEFATAVQDRVEQIRAAHPEMGNKPIPSDLVTNSGSGFDPHISPAAAEYQVDRLARTTGKSASEIRDIIKQCTEQPQFGFLGDARVNVLKVNLMLDGVL